LLVKAMVLQKGNSNY